MMANTKTEKRGLESVSGITFKWGKLEVSVL